jgi:hypothetical protein
MVDAAGAPMADAGDAPPMLTFGNVVLLNHPGSDNETTRAAMLRLQQTLGGTLATPQQVLQLQAMQGARIARAQQLRMMQQQWFADRRKQELEAQEVRISNVLPCDHVLTSPCRPSSRISYSARAKLPTKSWSETVCVQSRSTR